MSEHLPECQPTMCRCCDFDCESCETCICDRLRACEKRVTERHNAEHEDDRLTAFQNGYAAALDAARDQITARMATEPDIPRRTGMGYAVEEIDRLREAKS